jgi:hypothetical protein
VTIPQRRFGDPLQVLLRAEEESCKGCIHREVATNGTRAHCTNPASPRLLADQRCDEHEEE